MTRHLLVLVAAASLACTKSEERTPPSRPPPKCCAIGDDFLWGSATASHQVDGNTGLSDWYDWERTPEKIHGGDRAEDGPRHELHFEADLDAAKAMGHGAYRFSFDWARLQSAPGAALDPDEVAATHARLAALRARRLVPVVTLLHFALPRWLHDVRDGAPFGRGGLAGLEAEPLGGGAIVEAFEDFARRVGEEFGAEVDRWVTINEPLVPVAAGYLSTVFPPGTFSFPAARRAVANQLHAHARAYRALHEHDTVDADEDGAPALVSIAQHVRVIRPMRADREDDRAAAKSLDYMLNWSFVDMIARGTFDANLDGDFDDPDDREDAPELGPSLDWLGINYYSTTHVGAAPIHDAASGMTLPGLPMENPEDGVARNDLGWEIFPDGLRQVLVEAQRRYGLPLFVTENGIADAADDRRARFLVEHVAAMQEAMAQGADVRGYFHWSLLDNFEWAEGFAPRFGLLRVDYESEARTRTRTRGADAYQAIIEAGGVTDALRGTFVR